jgi:hypothetical protein
MYRCEAASPEAFVQQLACNLVNHGYWHYVAAEIPPGKDPRVVDAKLIAGYGLELSKWARARRKAKGKAKLSYLRYGRFFVLVATEGEHLFLRREGNVRDIRRQPIHFHGYSIGCSRGSDGRYHASVKIRAEAANELLAYFVGLATHRSKEKLVAEFQKIRFVPYARVRRQLLKLLRLVNDRRQMCGFDPVPMSALKLRRQIVRVFASDGMDLAETGVLSQEQHVEAGSSGAEGFAQLRQ